MTAAISASATDVRKGFSEFLDSAMRKPQFMKRRKQIYVTFPYETLDILFPAKITLRILRDSNGAYYTENSALPDIIGFGATKEEAVNSFIDDVVLYAYEYNDNYALYSASPNRAAHLPIVMKILSLFERDGDISGLMETL
ncbi:MAG: hypothetical protein LBO70_08190 [Clostridiales Family XIII bacterium]|jgi:hypothetical protein|nr:hypothetical protein [Clostridiales Family XIII bacterium]